MISQNLGIFCGKNEKIQLVLKVVTIWKEHEITTRKMPEKFIISTSNPNLVMQDHSYGKNGVKVLHLVRNGGKLNNF